MRLLHHRTLATPLSSPSPIVPLRSSIWGLRNEEREKERERKEGEDREKRVEFYLYIYIFFVKLIIVKLLKLNRII